MAGVRDVGRWGLQRLFEAGEHTKVWGRSGKGSARANRAGFTRVLCRPAAGSVGSHDSGQSQYTGCSGWSSQRSEQDAVSIHCRCAGGSSAAPELHVSSGQLTNIDFPHLHAVPRLARVVGSKLYKSSLGMSSACRNSLLKLIDRLSAVLWRNRRRLDSPIDIDPALLDSQTGFIGGHMGNKPNVLFIMTDQHRADHLGFMGNPTVRTPNFDSLAASGCVLKMLGSQTLFVCPIGPPSSLAVCPRPMALFSTIAL